ncbi:Methyltransferase [Plasmodium coatneyi]|uniref:Ribosomal RNA-processing protein 8 n=1 Tax=Plasmodium coatneyi TaxID=208452 RepID=A0A1B1DWU1_9APIC|nr:Methyltransferase [Plasmodium coatneyi]ANQ07263.1 Methyltransferase [Plasmodium coatneyi]
MSKQNVSPKLKRVKKDGFKSSKGGTKKSQDGNKNGGKKKKPFKKHRMKEAKQVGELSQSCGKFLNSKGKMQHADKPCAELNFAKKEKKTGGRHPPVNNKKVMKKSKSDFVAPVLKKIRINKKLSKKRNHGGKAQGGEKNESHPQHIPNGDPSPENVADRGNYECEASSRFAYRTDGNHPTDRAFFPDQYESHYGEKKKQKYKKKKKIPQDPEEIVNSSLFRYINEYMYTNKSDTVQQKLKETKNIFNIYHSGYRNQKNKWPQNPVHVIINHLKKNFTKKSKIADLGCGEAEIAQALNGWSVTSYDLIQLNEHVTICNITELPLPDNSYDCFVLCLSLMNTDWPKVIFEALRCLKKRATLIIADVVSRFTNYKAFMKFMKNVGFTVTNRVNLDDFFYVLFFENNKKDDASYTANEKRIRKVSKLLAPCIYKRR